MPAPGPTLAVGVLGRAHGLRGEITFRPYDPGSDLIMRVERLLLITGAHREEHRVLSARRTADGYLLSLDGVESRERAASLTLAVVHVDRASLPALPAGMFYVEDIQGATVVTGGGDALGTVAGIFWNGAHDVMTVSGPDGEHMIPVVPAHVIAFDAEARVVTVSWREPDDETVKADPDAGARDD